MPNSPLLNFQLNDSSTDTLPLVEAVFNDFKRVSLKNVCIIGAQHILPTTLQMLNSFFHRGLKPENVFLIGKCYSTDIETMEKMLSSGVYVCPSSFFFNKNCSFDAVYQKNISNFLNNFLHNQQLLNKQLIILDDGGTLLTNAKPLLSKMRIKVKGIEQTTSGYEKLKKQIWDFPILNVARSRAKLEYESPLIASTLAQQVKLRLPPSKDRKEKMLIIGGGAIGQAIKNKFADQYAISIYDYDSSVSQLTKHEFNEMLGAWDVIVGCTGTTVLDEQDFVKLKDGCTLISASSSDREFSTHKLRAQFKGALRCHDDFRVNGINVINCGFPVNFGTNAKITDPPDFQLTRALLTAAILSGLYRTHVSGLNSLEQDLQNLIIDGFTNINVHERIKNVSRVRRKAS